MIVRKSEEVDRVEVVVVVVQVVIVAALYLAGWSLVSSERCTSPRKVPGQGARGAQASEHRVLAHCCEECSGLQ